MCPPARPPALRMRQVASVGPDVQDCARNFPRAMLYAAGMQMVINGTIHLVAAGATDPALYPLWEPGYLRCGSGEGGCVSVCACVVFTLIIVPVSTSTSAAG